MFKKIREPIPWTKARIVTLSVVLNNGLWREAKRFERRPIFAAYFQAIGHQRNLKLHYIVASKACNTSLSIFEFLAFFNNIETKNIVFFINSNEFTREKALLTCGIICEQQLNIKISEHTEVLRAINVEK